MKLELNGQALAFSLDQERVLADFLPGVIHYARGQGFMLFDVKVDGVPVTVDNQREMEPLLLTDITLIAVEARPVFEISECLEALTLGEEALKSGDVKALSQLAVVWHGLHESLSFWLSDFNLGQAYFDGFAQLGSLFQNGEPGMDKDKQLRFLAVAVRALTEKDLELENPQQQLLNTVEQLITFRPRLEAVGSLLQNAQDAKATQEILAFMELFQKFIRCVHFLDDAFGPLREQASAWAHEVSEQMSLVTAAYADRDYVTAGDLAEYEVATRLEALEPWVSILGKQP